MFDKTIVSFPGLGIGEMELNKIAFTLFGKLEVRWYGLIITLGIICAVAYVIFRGKKSEHVIMDDIIDIALLTVILGVIGARAYYVLTTLDQYDTFGEAIAIWNGGLGIYGGIIGGCLGIVIMCLIKKISWRKLFDMAAPGVMIAQAMGRWGNFFNREAFGEYSDGLLAMRLPIDAVRQGEITSTMWEHVGEGINYIQVHPTFLYESLWNIGLLLLMLLLWRKKHFDGEVALLYFGGYGIGRFWIESLRTDQLQIGSTGIAVSQMLGLVLFVAALITEIVMLMRIYGKKRLEKQENS